MTHQWQVYGRKSVWTFLKSAKL